MLSNKSTIAFRRESFIFKFIYNITYNKFRIYINDLRNHMGRLLNTRSLILCTVAPYDYDLGQEEFKREKLIIKDYI